MSHEIRTPLNGVLGMLQLLQTTPLMEEQEEYLEAALNSGRSLIQIIGDILDLSRIEAGRLGLAVDEFDPSALLVTVLDPFKIQAKNKHINLYSTLDKNTPYTLQGDSSRIRQILFNLIGNAIKFTEQGEVHTHMEAGPTEENAGQIDLICSVSDTGIGISRDKLETVFEPFTQADGSHTRKYGGTGLGLCIVKRLVELMKGEIEVESEAGVGTTVRVRIPVRSSTDEQPVAKKPFETAALPSSLRVLLAEDDPSNQLMVKRLLEKQGHVVTCAATGKEALDALEDSPFDIILMDVQMPEMDGTAATMEIRTKDRFKDLPIIALTAHAMAGDRERFLEAGMNDYLAKPIDVEELKKTLRRAMAK